MDIKPAYLKIEQIQADIKSHADTDPAKEPRVGDICPECSMGQLDYDGMLNLACSKCGYTLSGCFT